MTDQARTGRTTQNGKGRDIGYALAAGFLRESQQRGVMHHHGPRCDHRFRDSKPQLLLAELVGFFGSGCPNKFPCRANHPIYFELASFI